MVSSSLLRRCLILIGITIALLQVTRSPSRHTGETTDSRYYDTAIPAGKDNKTDTKVPTTPEPTEPPPPPKERDYKAELDKVEVQPHPGESVCHGSEIAEEDHANHRRIILCLLYMVADDAHSTALLMVNLLPNVLDVVDRVFIVDFPFDSAGRERDGPSSAALSSFISTRVSASHRSKITVHHPAAADFRTPIARALARYGGQGILEIARGVMYTAIKSVKMVPHRDVIVANMDLEEIIHPSTFLAWRHCNSPEYFFVMTNKNEPNGDRDLMNKCQAAEEKLESFPNQRHAQDMQRACAAAGIKTSYYGYFPMTVVHFYKSFNCVAVPAVTRLAGQAFFYTDATDLFVRFQRKNRASTHNQRDIKFVIGETLIEAMSEDEEKKWYLEGLTLHLRDVLSETSLNDTTNRCRGHCARGVRELKHLPAPLRLPVSLGC